MRFYLDFQAKWNGTEGATLLRDMRVYLRPRRRSREGSMTARGKQVPAVQ
ncbi:hypothetical protein [Peribacillus muralis]